MLPRSERLNTVSFSVAFAGGRVLRHPLMQVRVFRRLSSPLKKLNNTNSLSQTSEPSHQMSLRTRVAFVVPKKLGKAAVRNRLRRRLREQYRLHPLRSECLRSEICVTLRECDLIFVVAPPALTASSVELAEAVTQLLRRASRASVELPRSA